MAGPFPGMDPYIEAHGSWTDFHDSLVSDARAALGRSLPPAYVPRINERVVMIGEEPEDRDFKPDVAVARQPVRDPAGPGEAAVATIEPVLLPIRRTRRRPERHVYLEIYKAPEMVLVTVVEVLSPTNKADAERSRYLEERQAWLDGGINLVEIDLLVRGVRLPFDAPLPRADYYAAVARAADAPNAAVYAWSIRRPLPDVPVPLRPADGDASIPLQRLAAEIHQVARYATSLPYHKPLKLPLSPEDRAWAEALAAAARAR